MNSISHFLRENDDLSKLMKEGKKSLLFNIVFYPSNKHFLGG